MTKQINLSTGIVALAIVLLSCLHVQAQATVGSQASNDKAKQEALEKENAIKATSTVEQNNLGTTQGSIQLSPAAAEELARLNNVLALTKSKWEDQRNKRELTPAETAEYNSTIADIESQINTINGTAKIKSTK